MAYTLDSKFDTSSIEQMNRRLARCSKEALPAVKASNEEWAGKLAALIARNTPRTSAKSAAQEGSKHKTKHGALKKATRVRVTGDSASIVGGGRAKGPAPHFYAQEFGGSVMWSSQNTSKRHKIGVAPPSPSLKSFGLFDRKGGQRGKVGWFFWPTLRRNEEAYVDALMEAAAQAVHTALARG